MKRNSWLFLFAVVLAADLLGIIIGNSTIVYIAKPAIVASLAGFFFTETKTVSNPLKKWIVLALFFSWAGDIALMFSDPDGFFFLGGLSSFLIAHIFYILFFHSVRIREGIKSNIIALLIVAVYYTALVVFLSPWLGNMKLPVRIYGVVISFMFMLAIHMLSIGDRKAGRWMFIGALLFVISDSVLALDKFYHHWQGAGLIIMLSYGLAQYFLVAGAVRYLKQDVQVLK